MGFFLTQVGHHEEKADATLLSRQGKMSAKMKCLKEGDKGNAGMKPWTQTTKKVPGRQSLAIERGLLEDLQHGYTKVHLILR